MWFTPQDNEKISALHEEREKKVQELEVHIDRMRNQQDQLHKKLKEEADRKIKMERDMQKQQQKIKELEDHTSQQQKVLKRKTEEVAAAQRRLRNVGKQGSEDKERYEYVSSLPPSFIPSLLFLPPSFLSSLSVCFPSSLSPILLFLPLSHSASFLPPSLPFITFHPLACFFIQYVIIYQWLQNMWLISSLSTWAMSTSASWIL